jgi:hypothetical protein
VRVGRERADLGARRGAGGGIPMVRITVHFNEIETIRNCDRNESVKTSLVMAL